jgi:hypothetical protein
MQAVYRFNAIFAAVLEHDQAQGSVVEGRTITWDCLGTITGLFPTLLHDETIEDFLTKSSASYALDKAAMAELGYPLGIGNANQKTSLARAGLSSAASQALIYKRMVHKWFSGGWTAEGIFFLLESRAGRWSVQRSTLVSGDRNRCYRLLHAKTPAKATRPYCQVAGLRMYSPKERASL